LNFYLDTSVVVSALSNEERTVAVQDWLAAQAPGTLQISEWVITEFSSAMALKLRTGQFEPQHRAECLAEFAQLVEESLFVLPVTSNDFRAAARYVDRPESGLRAGDALHLAVCAHRGTRLVTLDKTLATVATNIGVACLDQAELKT
jgi:predicted nucleic acid-binding protein